MGQIVMEFKKYKNTRIFLNEAINKSKKNTTCTSKEVNNIFIIYKNVSVNYPQIDLMHSLA